MGLSPVTDQHSSSGRGSQSKNRGGVQQGLSEIRLASDAIAFDLRRQRVRVVAADAERQHFAQELGGLRVLAIVGLDSAGQKFPRPELKLR